MEPEVSYKLRCELHGHQEDVRSVCVGDLGVVTSSRDTTIKIWAEDSPTSYSLVHTLVGHSKYVGAVTYAAPGLLPDMPNGAIVSGSFDSVVMVWDVASAVPVHKLTGHEYQVTAVVVLPNGDIASASVDKSIRLWRGGKAAGQLLGHEGPVLCLAVSEEGQLISGSGDHTLRRWVGSSCSAVYKGHTDTVRGVAILPGVGFVSASHDCSLRVWSGAGEVLSELLGHTAIIYSVAATAAGRIASGSEDNTVRLWDAGGSCLATIEHPGCVWAVGFTAAGDLVSGCSDAVARVWSASEERQAPAEAAAAYDKMLAERKAATAASSTAAAAGGDGAAAAGGAEAAAVAAAGLPPGVKVAESYELAQPGHKDGETKIVREGDGSIAAYGWDAGQCVWEKIGTVVDAPEPGSISGGRKWHLGREWDHVFDVEMDSGAKLKLALDLDENPYIVADRFLEQHDLPAEFKEQIVKFIIDNTGAQGAAPSTANVPITGGFCDPFTGGSSSAAAEQRPPSFYGPPAGSAANAAALPMDVTGGFVDPFTGGSSSSSRAQQQQQQQQQQQERQLPATAYMLFDATPPPDALRRKLLEFSGQLSSADDVPPDALISEEEAEAGGALDELLGSLAAAVSTNQPAAAAALSEEALMLAGNLLRWPAAQLFPGLDIARCLALHPAAADALAAAAGSMSAPTLGGLSGALAAAAVSELAPALQTALRLAANCFKAESLRSWALANRELLLDGFAGCCSAGGPGASKGVRLSAATLLLNFSIAAAAGNPGGASSSHGVSSEGCMQLLSGLEELLTSVPVEEGDAAQRALLALGTLLVAGGGEMVAVARDLGLGGQAARWAAASGKLRAVAQEVQALLR